MSSEMAASRALKGVIAVGDRVDAESVTGTIMELFGVKVEIENDEGQRLLVPYSDLLTGVIGIERSSETD